jgi:hypothetical protein
MEDIVAATLAPHALEPQCQQLLQRQSLILSEASCAFRATKAADAAARVLDVRPAQGGWEEVPGEEGGTTEK